jgi:predicted PurR-regulated permease PerM
MAQDLLGQGNTDSDRDRDGAAKASRMTTEKLVLFAVTVGIVYLAKDVLLPLAIAMLITFALSPLATRLRKLGLPNLPSVLVVVAIAFTAIGLFVLVVTSQLGTLAQNLPGFQSNIVAKVESLKAASSDNGPVSRIFEMISAINAEIGSVVPNQSTPEDAATKPTEPMPVQVVERQSTFDMLQNLVLPLISPIAMVGLVIVVVIFMLLEREDLRDRFIKLVGSSDLHRTTQVLQDAGRRVTQYLLVQLLVNVIYAVPIGLGLWLIGVPNATLWGLLTLVLRFVPYIGTVLAAAFPIFLAFAVAPGWSAILWTIALFATVELITSNVIEPYLYGSRTGVSPLAIIIAAIFWTWIWGPLGLVLSTPLTVCLVVLGRHIPQFAVFDVLFGDEPVLAPHARLYQRLLVGDGLEATFRAEETLETEFISDYYRDIGIPALLIAQNDHARGVLTTDQQRRIARSAQEMVADLAVIVDEELAVSRDAIGDGAAPVAGEGVTMTDAGAALPGLGYRVMCIGGRSDLDDAAAAMLAQALAAEGAVTQFRNHADLAPSRFKDMGAQDHDCLILTFLDPSPSRASLLHVRRIKLALPKVRVGVLIAEMPELATDDHISGSVLARVDEVALAAAKEIGADFVVKTLDAVFLDAFRDEPAGVPARVSKARRTRQATVSRRPVAT